MPSMANPADRLLIPTDLDAQRLAASRMDAPVRRLTGAVMGTGWSLAFVEPRLGEAEVLQALSPVFERVIAQMSGWEPASELCQFNQAAPGWRALSPDFHGVLSRALEIAEITGGAFDPCLAREVDALGFGPGRLLAGPGLGPDEPGHSPGWRDLRLDPSRSAAFQPGGAMLDLSSIAKGFAVDASAQALEAMGMRSFLMEIGGEFVGRGLRPDGQPWRVALELSDLAPAPDEPVRTIVALPGHALATSGDFVRGAHLLDGRTRVAPSGKLSGVAVIDETCMDADGWATALFVLGADEGMALADSRGLAAVFATRDEDGSRASLSAKAQEMLG